MLFSPIRVEPSILALFLDRLGRLEAPDGGLLLWFYDDNVDAASSRLLRDFVAQDPTSRRCLDELDLPGTDYRRDGATHHWSGSGTQRVALIKDAAIETFLGTDAEQLFLVDADVLLPSGLLPHLSSLGRDVVSEVYWTRFSPDRPYLPNVWDVDTYGFHGARSVVRLTEPGQYPVGGLGACTLIARRVLEGGVRFRSIPNLTLWGEDRHFCVRAAVAGFELWADTVMPPFHVYREHQLDEARAWLVDGATWAWFREHWLDRAWVSEVVAALGVQPESRAG